MPKPPGTYARIASKVKIGHAAQRDREFIHVAHQVDIDSAIRRLDMRTLNTRHRRLAALVAERRMGGGENEEWAKTVSEALETVDELTERFRLRDLEHLYGVKIDPVLLGKHSGVHELMCEIKDLRGDLAFVQSGSNVILKDARHGESIILLAIALCKFLAIVAWIFDHSNKKH